MVGQRMLHGLKWSVLGRGAAQAISWTFMLITIRLVQPEDFGLIALCDTVLIFIVFTNELGLGAALIQNERNTEAEIRAISSFFLLWNASMYLLLFLAAPLVADFYREPALTDVLRVLGLSLLILSFAVVPRSLLSREMRFKGLTLVKAGSYALGSSVTLLGALAGFGVWALVAGGLVGAVLETIGYHLVARMLPRFGAAFGTLRRHFRFGAAIMAQRLVWLAYGKADILVVGRMFPLHTTGIYSVGRELATLPLDRLGSAVNQVLFAGFSRIQHDRRAVGDLYTRGLGLLCFAGFPVFAGISAVADPLVRTVLGPTWSGAAAVIMLFAFTGPMRLVNTLSVEILNALGTVRANLKQVALTGALVVAGIVIGVQWGLLGLCIGWLAGYFIGTVLHGRCLARHVPMRGAALLRAILRPLLGCAVMYGAVFGALLLLGGQPDIVRLFAGIAAGVVTYAAWSLLFMRAELRTIRKALGKTRPA